MIHGPGARGPCKRADGLLAEWGMMIYVLTTDDQPARLDTDNPGDLADALRVLGVPSWEA